MSSLPYMRIIVPFIGVAIVVALGAYINLTWKQAEYYNSGPVIISVSGTGDVLAKPDIGTFSFSVQANGDDASTAQSKSAKAVNDILSYLTDQGVADKDVQTQNYSLSPHYEYTQSICNTQGYCPPGERVLRGYDVSQTITVKVRDTGKAGDLISGVGAKGATNVSSLQFTIDDETALKAEAREKAIADAKTKAEKLASDLGVRIVRMTNYNENNGPIPYAYGMGGADTKTMAVAEAAPVAPSVPTGENKVTVNVNMSYEVK